MAANILIFMVKWTVSLSEIETSSISCAIEISVWKERTLGYLLWLVEDCIEFLACNLFVHFYWNVLLLRKQNSCGGRTVLQLIELKQRLVLWYINREKIPTRLIESSILQGRIAIINRNFLGNICAYECAICLKQSLFKVGDILLILLKRSCAINGLWIFLAIVWKNIFDFLVVSTNLRADICRLRSDARKIFLILNQIFN